MFVDDDFIVAFMATNLQSAGGRTARADLIESISVQMQVCV